MSLVGHGAAQAGHIPVVVAELANADVASVAAPGQADDLREQYARGFFLGFLRPDDTGVDRRQADVERRGFEAGQAYWRDHPGDRERIFVGYGYLRVTVAGTWTTGWELNDFRPDGITDETWNIDALGGPSHVAGGDLLQLRDRHDHVPVVITAWVDPRNDRQVWLDMKLHQRFALVTAIWKSDGLGLRDPALLIQLRGSM